MRSKIQSLVIEAIRSNGGEDLDEMAACALVQDVLALLRAEVQRVCDKDPQDLDGFRVSRILDSFHDLG
jgi:hypothetical protein